MGKRFTDSEKWRDPWFCALETNEKIFWQYLLDNCSFAGIWQVNWPLVKFYIPDFQFDNTRFGDRIQVLNEHKWFIPKFIRFQYGVLQESNPLHRRIIFELNKEGAYMPLNSPLSGAQEKEEEEEEEKEKEIKKRNRGAKSKPTESHDPVPEPDLPENKKPLTDIQKIVMGWKILNSIPTEGEDSKAWDKVHFPRCAASAKSLLTLFGSVDSAVEAMEYVYMNLKGKRLDCTLETIVKRSDLYREYQQKNQWSKA